MTYKLKMLRSLRRPFRLLAFALLILMVVGCQAHEASEATMGLDVVGYNHTDHDIGDFSVNDQGGSFLMRHKGGGGLTCCVSIPRTYKPGMTVSVTWTDEAGEHPQTRIVPVPPYTPEDGGHFAVHFLRNGDVKVLVSMIYLESPDYPLKGEEFRL